MLEFQVIHQKIIRADNFFVVADSKNYLKASFSFTSEWTGSITAVFQLKGQQEGYYQVLDENNTCFVPWEVLSEACGFYVSVFCGDLITANKVFIPVNASGMINGTTPAEPTPDVYTQILDIAEEAENIAQSVRRDADEGLFDGKPGEPGTTDYNDLENKPDLSVYVEKDELKTINDESLLGEGNIEIIATVEWGDIEGTLSNQPDLQTALNDKADKSTTLAGYGITNAYTKTETEEKISDYALSVDTKYGASLSLTVNTSTYVLTAQLKDQNGDNLGSAQTVDLPLESVVVGGSYDDTTKKVKLTLQNGSTVEFSVADLVEGLQSEITASNKLNADLVDDSTSVNKFVTTSEKTTWDNKQNAISDLATIRTGASDGTTSLSKVINVEATIPTLATKSELPTLVDLAQAGEGIEFERKVVQGGDNYTIVGSPSIDANGIFTANSTGNYITSPQFDSFEGQNFEIEFTTPSSIGTSAIIVRFVGTGNPKSIGITTSYKLYISTPVSLQLQTTLSTDTSYIVKFISTGGVNTLSLYSSDGTLLEEKTNTNSITTLSPCTIQVGRVNLPFKFDLNKMSFGDWKVRTPAFDGYVINSNCMRLVYFSQNGADFCKVYEFTDPSTGEIKYWTEQQGRIAKPDANPVTVTYPMPMADTDYFFSPNQMFDGTGRTQPSFGQMTTTSVVVHQGNGASVDIYWTVCGLGVKPV